MRCTVCNNNNNAIKVNFIYMHNVLGKLWIVSLKMLLKSILNMNNVFYNVSFIFVFILPDYLHPETTADIVYSLLK